MNRFIEHRTTVRSAVLALLPLLVLMILLTGVAWWHVFESAESLKERTIETAAQRARQVDDTLSEGVSMLFNSVDQSVIDLIDDYSHDPRAEFERHAQLMFKNFPANSLLGIFVINPRGYIEYSTLDLKEKLYVGDREHFSVHQNDPNYGLYVSKPVVGRATKQWAIQFSRRIDVNGQFKGVMVVSLSPFYLYEELLKFPHGKNDSAWIARSSGEFLARNLDMENSIGHKPSNKRSYDDSLPGATGAFTVTSNIDQVTRMYQWRHLSDYPIIVGVGISKADLLAPVEQDIAIDHMKTAMATLLFWLLAILALYLGYKTQVSIRKRQESEFEANHDPLTGLANRKHFSELVELQIKAAASQPTTFGILFIDIDGFKSINDSHGHNVGDDILKAAAQRIARSLREGDTVARLGGDEFVALLTDVADQETIERSIVRIHRSLASPIGTNGLTINVRISIGSALFPADATTYDALIAKADQRMYATKKAHQASNQTL